MTRDRKTNDSIVAEAASWVAQIDGQAMTQADRAALREWAGRSPRHMEELRRLGEMWCDLDQILYADDAGESVPKSVSRVIGAGLRTRPKFIYAIATAFLVAVSIPVLGLLSGPEQVAPLRVVYQTVPGETNSVSLQDGSILHINTDTSLEYVSSASERTVNLHRGEVLVEVAKDPERPFSVRADKITTTAIGTIFSVRMLSDETVIMVTEGSVTLEPAEPAMAARAMLSAGDIASVEKNGALPHPKIISVAPEALSMKLSWKDGILIFDGDPLADVIDEISRYTTTKVVISDPVLREIPIGGVFPIGDVSPLIGALESSFGIEANYIDQSTVYLSRPE